MSEIIMCDFRYREKILGIHLELTDEDIKKIHDGFIIKVEKEVCVAEGTKKLEIFIGK